ncbi:MAG: adenylate/guanylate cyclase domain-containing protein [Desulfobacteraceae bacterium]
MKCPNCHFNNRENARFCLECGMRLELTCTQCGRLLPLSAKFCDECGQETEWVEEKEKAYPTVVSERKYVTVIFSDLSGYSSMSEKLDPEEVREIMSRLFGEIAQVVTRYEGFIEKFVGDAIMALFGVPKTHEDDPIRAIKAAREIHEIIDGISPEVQKKIGKPISMHTGVNTGLVVTGEVDIEKGTHGVAGETINLASRLSGLAKPGEILVGPETLRQAEGHFTFKALEPTQVKGKTEPVQIFQVFAQKERPVTVHRLSGFRADLIGRKAEMVRLVEAVENLREGKGRIFSICGDAGTGKSRLVEDFKATLDLNEIEWLEGHAYPYCSNVPYYPLIDLFNMVWQIEEGDSQEKVRERIETKIKGLFGDSEDFTPYIGRLYALKHPKIDNVDPEFWKLRLRDAVNMIFSALTKRARTVIYIGDIHWADPSSLELFRYLLSEFKYPCIFLCEYRTPFRLFNSRQLSAIGESYQEIQLKDLSASEAQEMVESMLKTENLPHEIQRFVQERVGGNPFYLEEVVNSLVEAGILARDNGRWRLTRSISEIDFPPTIHGVISARLDRLEKESKRVLQEASVIGKTFLYEILRNVTKVKEQIDRILVSLERSDFVRKASLDPDIEYVFKHALTQDVVYRGLLKKERQEIHEKIAAVIEILFKERLPEFYETLAFHFRKGLSVQKAIDYLVKSGEKSLGKYSLEESNQYFKEAFETLSRRPGKTRGEERLIDLLNKWAFIFYYRGDHEALLPLLTDHKALAESLGDKSKLGIFYTWLGVSLFHRENLKDAYHYLRKALHLGEQNEDHKVIGYSCNWLTWICAELGHLDEAILFGKRSQDMTKFLETEDFLYWITLAGIGQTAWYKGDVKKTAEAGNTLLEYGHHCSNIRALVLAHYLLGCSYFMSGDFISAIESYKRSIGLSTDPYYSQWPRMLLCLSYVSNGQFQEAEEALQELLTYTRKFRVEVIGTPAESIRGIVLIGRGNLKEGIRILEEGRESYLKNGRRWCYALSEYILGMVYLQIIRGQEPNLVTTLGKTPGLPEGNMASAGKKAETHFDKAIEASKDIGAKGTLGIAYFGLGLLYTEEKKEDKAHKCITEAIRLFEECGAEAYLKQGKEVLASLK